VTIEGILIVFGFLGIVITLDLLFRYFFPGKSLGYFIYIPALGIAYLAVIGIMKPLALWKSSKSQPRARELPEILCIIIPGLKGKNLSDEQIRQSISSKKPFEHLDKRRLWRNAIIFLIGFNGVIAVYFLFH